MSRSACRCLRAKVTIRSSERGRWVSAVAVSCLGVDSILFTLRVGKLDLILAASVASAVASDVYWKLLA
jgi:hypothetical protein